MTTEFATLPLAAIAPSLTNPRKYFDAAKLQELADSIAASGVHTPVLVRPLPGGRVADTDRGTQYELVAGERRYRASQLAGAPTIPAMVRALTDAQVLDIQLVENLQREDLSELEEADGFAQLMEHSSLNADQVGAKIGKSRSHVYARLRLLDLGTEGRAALREKKIEASTALLIARIPDSKLQAKALKEVLEGEWAYEGNKRVPMSHRKAQALMQNNYMLKLSGAVFDTKCETLLKGAGACTTCPKRTGHAPELFDDVKSADLCIDPPCFHKKEEAHSAAQVAAAQAKGQTVIAGKEAAELRGNGFVEKLKGYRRLDSAEDSPSDVPLRKLIGKQMQAEGIKPVLIENPRKVGDLVECLTNEVALRLLKAVQVQAASNEKPVTKEVQKLVNDKKAKAEAKAKEQYEQQWRNELMADAWREIVEWSTSSCVIGDSPFTTSVHRYLAVRAARNLSTAHAETLCKLLSLGSVSPISAVADCARETPYPERLQMLIIMVEASSAGEHSYDGRIPNEGLLLIAGIAFGPQLDEVINEIKAETKAKIWPNARKTLAITAPLAQPEHAAGDKPKKAQPAGKKAPAARAKLSAEDAKSGIAAAMQGMERAASAPEGAVAPPEASKGKGQEPKGFAEQAAATRQLLGIGLAIGQRVLIEAGKFKGKQGDVTKDLGGDCYAVKVKGRSVPTSVNMGHLTVVEGAAA